MELRYTTSWPRRRFAAGGTKPQALKGCGRVSSLPGAFSKRGPHMRTHALLVGGGLAVSLLLPPTSAQAFLLNLDQLFTGQTPAKQAHRRKAHRSGVGYRNRGHTLQ